jgi:hypothetical protein
MSLNSREEKIKDNKEIEEDKILIKREITLWI